MQEAIHWKINMRGIVRWMAGAIMSTDTGEE